MSSKSPKLAFNRVLVIGGVLASVVTIFAPVLQYGTWISENAAWALWLAVGLLVLLVVYLSARLEAVKGEVAAAATRAQEVADAHRAAIDKVTTDAEVAIGRQRSETAVAVKAAQAANAELQAHRDAERTAAKVPLSEQDRELAQRIYAYASDEATLTELVSFFALQIPRRLVTQIEDLSKLPLKRRAHDSELGEQLNTLAEAASEWLHLFVDIADSDEQGEFYSTKLRYWVSQAEYKRRMALSEKLGELGDDLHAKMLAYQRYYASL
ncbi:hypothetical protein [Microbacterium sp.]|uniref:hypothetical protein n=1 Tax=Microbacterium sp. TaxID=51671 RepID=UPI0033424193